MSLRFPHAVAMPLAQRACSGVRLPGAKGLLTGPAESMIKSSVTGRDGLHGFKRDGTRYANHPATLTTGAALGPYFEPVCRKAQRGFGADANAGATKRTGCLSDNGLKFGMFGKDAPSRPPPG